MARADERPGALAEGVRRSARARGGVARSEPLQLPHSSSCPRRSRLEQACTMSGWSQRAALLQQAFLELPAARDDELSSPDLRLHLALVRADSAAHNSRGASLALRRSLGTDPPHATDQLPPLKKLKTAALAVHDFPPLSTLSSSGSFARVELVRPASSLTGTENGPASAVFVMKTVDKRWAFRMRAVRRRRSSPSLPRDRLPDPCELSYSISTSGTSSPSSASRARPRPRAEYRPSSLRSSRRPRSTSSCRTRPAATYGPSSSDATRAPTSGTSRVCPKTGCEGGRRC